MLKKQQKRNSKISRVKLVADFLESALSPENYLDKIWEERHHLDGFNLLVSDGDRIYYASNYGESPTEVLPGIHGLSNGLLNDPWPKTELAKKQLEEVLSAPAPDQLLSILKSEEKYQEKLLPKTGASLEMEIDLSAQLIRMPPSYGTVSASAVIRDKSGKTLIRERSFAWDHSIFEDNEVQF